MIPVNPWIDRFIGLTARETIEARARRSAQPLFDLHKDSIECACDRIELELKKIFWPTSRCISILQMLLERLVSYADRNFVSEKQYLARCYSEKLPDAQGFPICLTGLAGGGKSHIGEAFLRVLPAEGEVSVRGHGTFPLVPAKLVKVESRKSSIQIFHSLASPAAQSQQLAYTSHWEDHCARWLYQSGVCSLGVDEMQFLTQSQNANTLVAQFLMSLTRLGVPLFYTCNYSLGHKLKKRPQQERQRLLSRPIVLLPDGFESDDWVAVILEYERALPDVFAFSFQAEAKALWSFTAGIKRSLVQLLVLSYREARQDSSYVVTMRHVSDAYHSVEYSIQREDVKWLFTYGLAGEEKGRPDLVCPFQISAPEKSLYMHSVKESRKLQVAAAAVESVMTQSERKAREELETVSALRLGKVKPRRVPMPKRPAKTLESMQGALRMFKDGI